MQKQLFVNKNPKCDLFDLKEPILHKHRINDSTDELSSEKLSVLANMKMFSSHFSPIKLFFHLNTVFSPLLAAKIILKTLVQFLKHRLATFKFITRQNINLANQFRNLFKNGLLGFKVVDIFNKLKCFL